MGQVLDLRRLRAAYQAVRSNRGERGVDGVTVEAFGVDLEANLAALAADEAGWESWVTAFSGTRRPGDEPSAALLPCRKAVPRASWAGYQA